MNQKYFQKIVCFVLFFTCIVLVANAQEPIEKSTEKMKVGAQIYYVHTVKAKETLYALGKTYGVTVEQIRAYNPELANGLKEGQIIRIPLMDETPDLTDKKNNVQKQEPQAPRVSVGKVYHLVKKQETLWSIAQAYGTSAEELKKLNPEAFKNNELMTGAVLQIPPSTATQSSPEQSVSTEQPQVQAGKTYYVVKPKETLWSIAHAYGLSPDEVRKQNPDAFKNGELMSGAVLYIPVDSNSSSPGVTAQFGAAGKYTDLLTDTDAAEIPFTKPVKAALVLPLLPSGSNVQAFSDSLIMDSNTLKIANTDNYCAFYEGALLAVETLKKQGLQLQLSVYDSSNDKNVADLVRNETLENEDIIVGPIYAAHLKPIAEFAKEHEIKIVSPLDPTAESLTIGNPYMFQLSPPVSCRQKKLIDDILAQKEANIIMVSGGAADSALVEIYKTLLGEKVKDVRFFSHRVRKGSAVKGELERLMVQNKMNCVIVASNQEALVSDIAANLYLLTFRNRFTITLYGTDRWRNFETIDLKYFHALNLHMVVPFFVDYENEKVKNFIARFQEIYKADPSQYAFQGYDTFYYFLQAMMNYGKDFEKYLSNYYPELLQTNYVFKYNGDEDNGLVNVESCLINYTPEYRIVKE